ncbi:hypothetical protein PoB_002353500 [Plakobranchus ocellatus]|uniref:G-protein coupled receptors family 1 profile domain-containing protein n=1 Tax=Plakobranchus ocellatus TaxID=259542 RepID=A0AAV3ZR10_9GAST|nr:hypothetical protein PoB_002353500 [Plakobranchus ocellatus]
MYAYYGTILHFTALIVVWVCTIYLVLGLKRKAITRKEKFKTSLMKEDNLKELRVIKTVFLLAVTYLVCSIPTAITMLVPQFVQEFDSTRALARINRVSHMFSGLMMQSPQFEKKRLWFQKPGEELGLEKKDSRVTSSSYDLGVAKPP